MQRGPFYAHIRQLPGGSKPSIVRLTALDNAKSPSDTETRSLLALRSEEWGAQLRALRAVVRSPNMAA